MRMLKLLSRNVDGASALEFALVLPVFAAMLFGSIQMGMAYYYAGSVQFALERTARIVMVDQDMSTGQVQSAFSNELSTFIDQTIALNYSVDESGDVPIGVFTAAYEHEFIIPFVPGFTVTFDTVTRVPLDPTALAPPAG